ncbi:MAG: T9SS type A sorting domain-containing protein [Candidatus Kapabacteria bacterium]|nr:T9SS type A sorting domain-containing protein [Candidatus Kapabacteria bacterium]
MKKPLLILIALLTPLLLFSQNAHDELLGKHYNLYMGTKFYFAIPPNELNSFLGGNDVEVIVNSERDCEVSLESPRQSLLQAGLVKAGIPYTFVINKDNYEVFGSDSIKDKGIVLTATKPVSVMVMNIKTGSSDGFMVLPEQSLGMDYLHCAYFDFNESSPWASGFLIVCTKNATTINIDLNSRGSGKTAGGKVMGSSIKIILDQNQTYLINGEAASRGSFDLSGTHITSDKPVAVIAFHQKTMIPSFNLTGGRSCMAEMLPSTDFYGTKFAVSELQRGKGQGDFFRMLAHEDNTYFKIRSYDQKTKQLIYSFDSVITKANDFWQYLEINASDGNIQKSIRGVTYIETTKPVMLMQYSYSSNWDANTKFNPFMSFVMPIESYAKGFVFSTPKKSLFTSNFLNIFAAADTSDANKTDLKSLKIDNTALSVKDTAFLKNNIPNTNIYWSSIALDTGFHTMGGNAKFSAEIYGTSTGSGTFINVSYGTTIGGNFITASLIDTVAPVIKLNKFYNNGDFDYAVSELTNDLVSTPVRQVDQGIMDIRLLDSSYNYNLEFSKPLAIFPRQYSNLARLTVKDYEKPAKAYLAAVDRVGNCSMDSIIYSPTIEVMGGKTACTHNINRYYIVHNPMYSYQWGIQGGKLVSPETGDSILVRWDSAGTAIFNIIQTNTQNGAVSNYIINLVIYDVPVVSFSGSKQSCQGSSEAYIINSMVDVKSNWKFKGCTMTDSVSNRIVVTWDSLGTGKLTLIQTNSDGCYDSLVFDVKVNPIPVKPTVTNNSNVLISSADKGNQWYFNGAKIAGATSKIYPADINGDYTVQITDSNGCVSKMSDIYKFIKNDVNEPVFGCNSFKINISQNYNYLLIEFDASCVIEDLTMYLFDLTGNLISTNAITNVSGGTKLNISSLKTGIYLMKIGSGAKVDFRKLNILR